MENPGGTRRGGVSEPLEGRPAVQATKNARARETATNERRLCSMVRALPVERAKSKLPLPTRQLCPDRVSTGFPHRSGSQTEAAVVSSPSLDSLEGGCMALEAGTRLGPYEILEPLGAGGMGKE